MRHVFTPSLIFPTTNPWAVTLPILTVPFPFLHRRSWKPPETLPPLLTSLLRLSKSLSTWLATSLLSTRGAVATSGFSAFPASLFSLLILVRVSLLTMLVDYFVCEYWILWLFGLVWFQLSRKVMDMRELRRIACQGVPDTPGLRSTLWKVRFIFQCFEL